VPEISDVYGKLLEVMKSQQSKYLGPILAKLITPQQAELLLQLPASAGELAAKFQRNEGEIAGQLEDMIRKGMVIPRVRDGKTSYFFVRSILQFHDSTGVYEPVEKEVEDLWRQWRETEVYDLCREWDALPIPIMRVFPSRSAVKDDAGILPHEDLWAIAARAKKIAVVKCVCRHLLKRCSKPVEVCLTFDAAAEYALRRGVGRQLSYDESLELMRRCEEEGMVPSNLNSQRVTAMCFCCSDCCIFIQPQLQYGYRLLSPSRYEAEADPDLCSECQECVGRCQFGAIEMWGDGSSKRQWAVVDPGKCYGCGVCVIKCPSGAMSIKLVRPPEHIPEQGPRY
jgi:ferredoxin